MVLIQILGEKNAASDQLADYAKIAAEDLGIDFVIERITKPDDYMRYGIMITPALVINSQVRCKGKIPFPAEIGIMIKNSFKQNSNKE